MNKINGGKVKAKRRVPHTLYGIWDTQEQDWVRELASKVDDGGDAILVFTSRLKAQCRAAQHWGYAYYGQARRDGWCEIVVLTKRTESRPADGAKGQD